MQKSSNSKSLDKIRTTSNLNKLIAISNTGQIEAIDSPSSLTRVVSGSVTLTPSDRVIKYVGGVSQVITTYNYLTVPIGFEYSFIVKNISGVNVTVDGLGATRTGTQIVSDGEEIEFFIRLVSTGWVALVT